MFRIKGKNSPKIRKYALSTNIFQAWPYVLLHDTSGCVTTGSRGLVRDRGIRWKVHHLQ